MNRKCLRFGNWRFLVDIDRTKTYSDIEADSHCMCGYCRNFYAGVDAQFPNLRPFLQRFGVNVEAPDELIPYEPTLYDGYYAVAGSLETSDDLAIVVDGLYITAESFTDSHIQTELDSPYFVLKVEGIRLPWLLEEDAEDVVSPANEPSFIQKIVDRFIKA